MNLIPNPAQNLVSLISNIESGRLDLLNVNGTLIRSYQLRTAFTNISVADLPKGIYLIKVMDQNGFAIIKKLVKD